MAWWILLILIFLVWCLYAVAAGMQVAVENAYRPLPSGPRGISVTPYFLCPFILWGAAKLIDLVLNPWGTTIFGWLHAAFAVVLLGSIFRDWRRLRAKKL